MYNVAVDINPKWNDSERARIKETLIYKLAKMGDFNVSAVQLGVTFEERKDYGERMILVATFSPRHDLYVAWRDTL